MGIETGVLLAYAGAAGAVVGAGAAIYSAEKQEDIADANAEMQRRQGNAEKDAAVAQAEKIRKAARAQAGAANAALAASGVAIGEGTAIRINEQILEDGESDAYSTMLTGERRKRFADDSAGITKWQGKAAKTAGYISATGSLLSAGAVAGGGWKASAGDGSSASGMGGGTGLKAPSSGFWGGQ